MEEGIGRVGMKMLMMIEGMGMISNTTRKGKGRDNMGLLLDKATDRARVTGMAGSARVVFRLTYMT